MSDPWTIAGVVLTALGVLVAIFYPEVRKLFRLDRQNPPAVPVVTTEPKAGVEPQQLPSPPIIHSNDPVIPGYELFVPGIRLSALKAAYPHGVLDRTGYIVSVRDQRFKYILVSFHSVGNDPQAVAIAFCFQNKVTRDQFARDTIARFGPERLVSKMLGTVLQWPNIGGCTVEIDERLYTITNLSIIDPSFSATGSNAEDLP